ncbi:alpha/beta fold hydrolase [Aquibacillus sediminis]|uniref:alpha/beta fold hydrolase n=1 Tax=Aquibacillus sediminis TaxID=2574734 RepID=UPI001107C2F1|nr:alpha/beta fold hydrolase [Aquibacillus sediminis]
MTEKRLDYNVVTNGRSKEWAVFFHGIGGNHRIFYKQIDMFKQHYNLLFIDLPGHGNSPALPSNQGVLPATTAMVLELLDDLKIESAHFIGISLGTIVMQHIAIHYPNRVASMVLAGAVNRWLKWGELLGRLVLSRWLRNILPYMLPYIVFAYLLMPNNNHKQSRDIFIREAYKLGKQSYHHWAFVLLYSYKTYDQLIKSSNAIPKLYISGEEDHMFIKGITSYVKAEKNAELHLIETCGHVCNIEKHMEFNHQALQFIQRNKRPIGRVS